MKMGEVGEDAKISPPNHHHVKLASNTTVVKTDHNYGQFNRIEGLLSLYDKPFVEQLPAKRCFLRGEPIISGEPSPAHAFASILPSTYNRRRKYLFKKYLRGWKRHSSNGNTVLKLKGKNRYTTKFLESLFVRNVIFETLPHVPAPAFWSFISNSLNHNCTLSCGKDEKSKCGVVVNSGENTSNSNEKTVGDKCKSLLYNFVHSCVPNPSEIPETTPSSGSWFNCLSEKRFDKAENKHLLYSVYGTAKKTKSGWLNKQLKKSRSPSLSTLNENKKESTPDAAPPSQILTTNGGVGSDSETNSPASDLNSPSITSAPILVNNSSNSKPSGNFASGGAANPVQIKKPTTCCSTATTAPADKVIDVSNLPVQNLMLSRSQEKRKQSKEITSSQVTAFTLDESGKPTAISLLKVDDRPGRIPSPTKTLVNSRKLVDTSKPGTTTVSSNSSEINTKSVISGNSNSSSSPTTVNSGSLKGVSPGCNTVTTSPSQPAHVTRGVSNSIAKLNSTSPISSVANSTIPNQVNHGGSPRGRKPLAGPKPPKKYSEKMKAEASVVQRISELQKEGMWWEKRLPKVYEPPKTKAHWDYLLEEMTWMATDFVNERKWKRNAAKKCARMIEKYFNDKENKRLKAEKEEEIKKKRTASAIAKSVRQFWSNVQTVVEFKEQCIIESMRKQALDQKLSYLVNETEKYSEIVAQTFTSLAVKTGIEEAKDDSNSAKALSAQGSSSGDAEEPSTSTVAPVEEDDVEFVPPVDSESDVDDTIAEEEAKEKVDPSDHKNELNDLEAENNMSIEELLAKYSNFINNPDSFKEPDEPAPAPVQRTPVKVPSVEGRVTRRRTMSERQLRASSTKTIEIKQEVFSDPESDDSSNTEEESEEDAAETEMKDGLASLVKSNFSPIKNSSTDESSKLADLAESFQPKGYTLSSTKVVTKVPHILRHSLREYQHIGLDWLVTMYDKRLNGILADEMGLGKTIQTIALLAYLAVDRGNWGPHLIIVPTSVMLNWEMEFKKWCPGFKILTYYGSQKERKQKRSGWTKPNAFHVCITSYKLVIQDHQSFRRKRWKYLILDEAQNIKNFKSQRWQLLLNFHTQRRLLLTGTPLQNNLMELWSLLHFLMPNVFQSHMEFKDWFSNPLSGMVEGSQEYNEDIILRLHKVLRPFILRRMKSEVEKQLPQKYEHVVMCSLSKRQRFLYEEFMSRTKTRNTLSQGSLLSVINVLMQLRKVCNHPNLFEPRPIVSPFQSEGIAYDIPSCVWEAVQNLREDSFRQSFPLFTISNPRFSYSEDQAKRIDELTPLFAYNPDENRRYVGINYEQVTSQHPPAKRIKRIVNLVKSEPPPFPRLSVPLMGILSGEKMDKLLEDNDFVDCLKDEAAKKSSENLTNGSQPAPAAMTTRTSSGRKCELVDLSGEEEQEEMDLSEESDFEEVIVVKKRKVAKPKFDIKTRLQVMGCTVQDFELDYIQDRKLQDRKLVVDNLNKVNWVRCYVQTFMNQHLVEKCQIIGTLPPLRLTSRRAGGRLAAIMQRKEAPPRDYEKQGYFKLAFNDIKTMINIRQECPALLNHPRFMWLMTNHLNSLIKTPENMVTDLMDIIKRFVVYIPAVSAPSIEEQMFRPSKSIQYFKHIRQMDEYRNTFSKPAYITHPTASRMLTQFPDPRLIQYDCGKLQTLDTLLRRLKTENHRVLIFTQMAKVLDILESFLNYHGYIYLRLDGATKIDQRQLLMERFNADKKIFCFILSTRSGGIGVNLTGADTVIFYDSDWNPTMDAQAQDRCHRIGQTRDVHIYRLVSEKTVEENILKKSNQKRLLGELAIEGGKFTTSYFKQHTIRELFTINENDDVAKRLNVSGTTNLPVRKEEEDDSSLNPSDLMRSPEKKQEMQMIECALAAAEDDTDVQAAQTVHAEAEAEMAEFDETVALDMLDDGGKSGPNRFEIEFQQVYEQLNDVERYAIKFMEESIDDWSKETVAQAQKDLEEEKLAWELQQAKTEISVKMEVEDDASSVDDMLTYNAMDTVSQVWLAQLGNFEQEMLFPLYEPPTPPRDEMDVYFDVTHGYLYDYGIMREDQLPPVYVPKHPKKQLIPVSPVTKTEKTPEPVKDSPEVIEIDSDSPTKKSPKIGSRREDPMFAPKSLFDRPTPAMAKMRRDLRMQRYSGRQVSTPPKTLGPNSVTFPIQTSTGTLAGTKAPPPPAPQDSPDWMYAEDFCLLQCIRGTLELPLNLFVVNLAQTPNWDYAQDCVNLTGFCYRTWKQCKWRYENFVAPREEGKLLFDSSSPASSDPGSPSSGKKKKAKAFIKITPPSPSKAARIVKVSQLLSQDNNAQFRSAFCSKFDTIKTIANKRAPTTKPFSVTPQVKSNKHSQMLSELEITYDSPISATVIAQTRYDRLQLERKKIEMQRQQQVAAAAAAFTTGNTATISTPTNPQTSQPPTAIVTAGIQRFQTGTIITTSAPSIQVTPQTQATSLAPMIGSTNQQQQMATKLIQNSQSLAALVQSSPTRTASPSRTASPTRTASQTIAQSAASKLSPLQLQYLKQTGIIRQSSPVNTSMQQIKDQLLNAQQIKRIQVVAAPPPTATIVSSAGSSVTQQPPPPVSLPPVSTITNVSTFSSLPSGATTSAPVVAISSSGTTSKPHVTIMHCPASDAEVAAFLKSINQQAHSTSPGTKTPVVGAFPHGAVNVPRQPTLLTVGLQNIMKVHQSPAGPVATLVKSPGGQPGHPKQPTSQPLPPQQTLPTVATFTSVAQPGRIAHMTTQHVPPPGTLPRTTLPVQQVMARSQPPQPTQTLPAVATFTSVAQSGKIATQTMPPRGTMPTHVVVQTQKQLPNTIGVQQLQQVFKQVGATGQVLQPQIIGKPITAPNNITAVTVTTSSTAPLAIPSSATSTANSPFIPTNPIHARIVPVSVSLTPQPGGVKQTIQVVSGPPNPTILGNAPLTVRPPSTSNSTHHTIQLKLSPSIPPPEDNN